MISVYLLLDWGIYKVSYQILFRFSVEFIRTREKFFEKNFYVQEINVEKRQKLSAIVTTISDKQYHND
jgi:hypothetical protein